MCPTRRLNACSTSFLEDLSIPLEELEEEVPGDREVWESQFSPGVAKNGWVDNIGITKKN